MSATTATCRPGRARATRGSGRLCPGWLHLTTAKVAKDRAAKRPATSWPSPAPCRREGASGWRCVGERRRSAGTHTETRVVRFARSSHDRENCGASSGKGEGRSQEERGCCCCSSRSAATYALHRAHPPAARPTEDEPRSRADARRSSSSRRRRDCPRAAARAAARVYVTRSASGVRGAAVGARRGRGGDGGRLASRGTASSRG